MFGELLRRLRYWKLQREEQAALDEEMRLHQALRAERLQSTGMTREDAALAAKRAFGNSLILREESQQMWIARWLDDFVRDIHIGLRSLLRTPGFTFIAVATIALGLGANTAIFTFVDAVLLKPLPHGEPERLVDLFQRAPKGDRHGVTGHDFLDYKGASKTLDILALTDTWYTLTGRGDPQRVKALLVSPDYFSVMKLPLASGRAFLPEEGEPGKDHVVVLSNKYWLNEMGGRADALGSTLILDGSKYQVIGILPAGSLWDRHWSDVVTPLSLTYANSNREFFHLGSVARLRPGATIASAQSELDALARRIAAEYPALRKGWGVTIVPYLDHVVGPELRQSLYVLLCAVVTILLIGCVNLANLLLARSAAREREMSLRIAIGAGRGRLIRQLVAESLLLSVSGAVAGLGVGYFLWRELNAWLPEEMLPSHANPHIDWRTLAVLAALSILSGFLFGLAPALVATRRDVSHGLQEAQRGSSGGRRGQRLRSALVIAEVAMAFVLVSMAGLLISSFHKLNTVSNGFDPTNVLTLQLPRAMGKDTDGAALARFVHQVFESVKRIPGVQEAAFTNRLPTRGSFGMAVRVEESDVAARGAALKMITPSYFRTLGIRLMSGRALAETDVEGSPLVTVVNETFAKRNFSDQNPIGKRIFMQRIVTGQFKLGPWTPWEIVGVIADEKIRGLERDVPGVYVPFDQSPIVGFGMVIRTQGDPMLLSRAIQEAIWSVRKDQAVTDIQLLDEVKEINTADIRFRTWVLVGFAFLALLLAVVGIYGVVAYSVTQRTKELGIRAALGASRQDLLHSAMQAPIMQTVAGLAAGAVASYWSGQFVSTLLFHTSPTEAGTLLTVALVVIAVAVGATMIPAVRASNTDPAITLRHE